MYTYLFSSVFISVEIKFERNNQWDIKGLMDTNLFSSIFINVDIKFEWYDQRDIEAFVPDFPAVLLPLNLLSHFQL